MSIQHEIDMVVGLVEAARPDTVRVVRVAALQQIDEDDLIYRTREILRDLKHKHVRACAAEEQERLALSRKHYGQQEARQLEIDNARHNYRTVRDAQKEASK